MQRQLTFGGWVSPRNTRLRGQGAIEYVLVIAIIVLVVMIAGPWVSSAIRNQFNTAISAIMELVNAMYAYREKMGDSEGERNVFSSAMATAVCKATSPCFTAF